MERTADFDKLERKNIVEVEWWDHQATGDVWISQEAALNHDFKQGAIRSIGYLLEEDAERITIAESMAGGNHYGHVRYILQACIVSRYYYDRPSTASLSLDGVKHLLVPPPPNPDEWCKNAQESNTSLRERRA